MIRFPRPVELTPWDPLPNWPKKPNPKGGLIQTLIDMLTGGNKPKF